MSLAEIVKALDLDAKLVPARSAERRVPDRPGLYSIFIDDPDNRPSPFKEFLSKRKTRMVYLGRASTSLQKRLVTEDLRHKKPSTFFRTIGAVLGYKPAAASLKGKKNQTNYRFTPQDTRSIINWIDCHLSVRWVTLPPDEAERGEQFAIPEVRPLLNTSNNPDVLPEVGQLREQCRAIARGCV